MAATKIQRIYNFIHQIDAEVQQLLQQKERDGDELIRLREGAKVFKWDVQEGEREVRTSWTGVCLSFAKQVDVQKREFKRVTVCGSACIRDCSGLFRSNEC